MACVRVHACECVVVDSYSMCFFCFKLICFYVLVWRELLLPSGQLISPIVILCNSATADTKPGMKRGRLKNRSYLKTLLMRPKIGPHCDHCPECRATCGQNVVQLCHLIKP